MTVTLGMHEASRAHIGARLDALGLDLNVVTFDDAGMFTVGGAKRPPAAVELDFLWLSQQLNRLGVLGVAFDTALACRRVGVLQTFNAGLDTPVYAKLSAKGVRILNSSAQGIAISEYVIAQVLAVLQPIEEQRRMQAAKEWRVTRFREISRTRWLIVGYGPIGRAIADRVRAFGAKIDVIRRAPGAINGIERVGQMDDLDSFAGDADVVVLACPLNASTRGKVGPSFFAGVKDGAILANVARGGLIQDAALIEALDAGRLETAILDVFHEEPLPEDDPLWTHPKVRMTPHTSFAGDGVQDRWDELFLDAIQRFCRGEALPQEVDASTFA